MQKHYDAVIVGGGTIGLASAALLATQGFHVALVEAHYLTRHCPEEVSVRVSAVNESSQRLLEYVGAWPFISNTRLGPYESMQVWQAASNNQSIALTAASIGRKQLGFIIENHLMEYALVEACQRSKHVDFFESTQCESLDVTETHAVLTHATGYLKAPVLIAADGARSWVRKQLNWRVRHRDYDQQGIVAQIETSLPHKRTAYQVCLDTGPLALLPLQDVYRCSIVWSADTVKAQALMAMDDDAFNQALTDASEGCLGDVSLVSKRHAFSLCSQHAVGYVHPRVALVGDAAHVIHPLAGQGMNLGFLDVAYLGEVLQRAHEKGRDIGALEILKRYERRQYCPNQVMGAAMTTFKSLLANQSSSVAWLRTMSAHVTQRMPWVAKPFIHYALGARWDLPESMTLSKRLF